MTYRSGDFIELANGKTVRLTAETAEIANAAAEKERANG